MKNSNYYPCLKVAAVAVAVTCGLGARATSLPAAPVVSNAPGVSSGGFAFVAFGATAEADHLRRAYRILATGDHDYKGHRVHAMHAVERAGKLLGLDLSGDLKDRSPQALSDERLREAEGLINQVLGAAEVSRQKRVVKDLKEAVSQITTALAIR